MYVYTFYVHYIPVVSTKSSPDLLILLLLLLLREVNRSHKLLVFSLFLSLNLSLSLSLLFSPLSFPFPLPSPLSFSFSLSRYYPPRASDVTHHPEIYNICRVSRSVDTVPLCRIALQLDCMQQPWHEYSLGSHQQLKDQFLCHDTLTSQGLICDTWPCRAYSILHIWGGCQSCLIYVLTISVYNMLFK